MILMTAGRPWIHGFHKTFTFIGDRNTGPFEWWGLRPGHVWRPREDAEISSASSFLRRVPMTIRAAKSRAHRHCSLWLRTHEPNRVRTAVFGSNRGSSEGPNRVF